MIAAGCRVALDVLHDPIRCVWQNNGRPSTNQEHFSMLPNAYGCILGTPPQHATVTATNPVT